MEVFLKMGGRGLEPPFLTEPDPKSGASAISPPALNFQEFLKIHPLALVGPYRAPSQGGFLSIIPKNGDRPATRTRHASLKRAVLYQMS